MMELTISDDNEIEIKQIVLDSVSLVDNEIEIDTTIFDILEETELKELFNNDYFKKVIEQMYQEQILVVNEQGEFNFVEIVVKSQVFGVWIEIYWYWFGYWKLYFNNQACELLVTILDNAKTIAEILALLSRWFPIAGLPLTIFAAFCQVNSAIFESYNYGNGVWIGWYLGIPNMGWGSN